MQFSMKRFLRAWPLGLFIVGVSYVFITLPRINYALEIKWVATYVFLSVLIAGIFAIDFRGSGGTSGEH